MCASWNVSHTWRRCCCCIVCVCVRACVWTVPYVVVLSLDGLHTQDSGVRDIIITIITPSLQWLQQLPAAAAGENKRNLKGNKVNSIINTSHTLCCHCCYPCTHDDTWQRLAYVNIYQCYFDSRHIGWWKGRGACFQLTFMLHSHTYTTLITIINYLRNPPCDICNLLRKIFTENCWSGSCATPPSFAANESDNSRTWKCELLFDYFWVSKYLPY